MVGIGGGIGGSTRSDLLCWFHPTCVVLARWTCCLRTSMLRSAHVLAVGLACAKLDANWKQASTSGSDSTPRVHSSYERLPSLSTSITRSSWRSSFTC